MTEEDIWDILKNKPVVFRERLWSKTLDGHKGRIEWYPSPEHIAHSLKDVDSVVIRVWENQDWMPTDEQVRVGLDSAVGVRRAVLWNKNWKISNDFANQLASAGRPYEQISVWSRRDWVPEIDLIEKSLKEDSFIIKQIVWLRSDWEQTPEHIEMLLNTKDERSRCAQLVWQRENLKYTPEQFVSTLNHSVKDSGDIEAANVAFRRKDWPKDPVIIQRGLSGEFIIKKERWEIYRPILEAALLKEKCGVDVLKSTPHSAL